MQAATLTAFGNMAMVILLYSPPADLSQAVSSWRLTLVEHLGGLLVLLTILIAGGNLLLLFLVGRGTWRQARAQPRRPVLSVSAVAVALPSEQAQAVASPSARQKEPEL